ncbi:hypothetical protein ACFL6X_03350 [Candidatus Latescibacterota bacterium]
MRAGVPTALLMLAGVGLAAAQDNMVTVGSISDLKQAIQSGQFQTVLEATNSWLPDIVAATEWDVRLTEHFVFHYHDDSGSGTGRLDTIAAVSDQFYDEQMGFFEIVPESKQDSLALLSRLEVFVIDSDMGMTFGFLPQPRLLFFVIDADQTPDYIEKMRHEYAHWVWARLYGEAPSLFYEGVATYAERESGAGSPPLRAALADVDPSSFPPLTEAAKNDVFWQHKGMYTAGSLLVQHLVEEEGWEPLKQLFLATEFEDPNVGQAFQRIYGRSLGDVDGSWREFARTASERD